MIPKDKEMLMLMSKEELVSIILAMQERDLNNYQELRKQYETSLDNEKKWGAKRFGGKKSMESFREGLLSGMVLLNPKLISQVMNGKTEIDYDL